MLRPSVNRSDRNDRLVERRDFRELLLASLLLFLPAIAAAQNALPAHVNATKPGTNALAVEHATVLPMNSDTALIDHTVITAGDRIVWVGPSRSAQIPRHARRLDARGAFLIPGLADMHVHIRGSADLPRFVAAGVTTVRNMNGQPAHLVLRRRVARGQIPGPRIYTAGPSIFNKFSLFGADKKFARVRTAQDAEQVVRDQSRAGYDMIKVLNGIKLPVYNRLLEAARAARMPVVGHVVSQVGAARSLAAGQVSLEHAELSIFDNKEDLASGARAIARAGAWVGTIISDRNGACAPPTMQSRRVIGALRQAGVRMLAGSDTNIGPIIPGAGLRCELETLVAAGLTPYEALVTATVNPGKFAAKHLKESVPAGTLTVGARADMLVLNSDPRIDIRSASRPRSVIVRGILLSKP